MRGCLVFIGLSIVAIAVAAVYDALTAKPEYDAEWRCTSCDWTLETTSTGGYILENSSEVIYGSFSIEEAGDDSAKLTVKWGRVKYLHAEKPFGPVTVKEMDISFWGPSTNTVELRNGIPVKMHNSSHTWIRITP